MPELSWIHPCAAALEAVGAGSPRSQPIPVCPSVCAGSVLCTSSSCFHWLHVPSETVTEQVLFRGKVRKAKASLTCCVTSNMAHLPLTPFSSGLAFSSGMGAILNICHLLKTGDKIVSMDEVYEGTRELFEKIKEEYNLKVDYVDCTDLKELEAAITPDTKLVWLETPTNPTLKVIDIQACADVAHRQPGVLLAVDNSFMSAYFQRPLSLGADICVSSATKYMNGHSDVLMGLVSVNRDDLYERLKFLQIPLGAVPSPFDCFLCNRGLKTLHIRMKLHFHNGLAVAEFLESRPRVEKVIYPGERAGVWEHPQGRGLGASPGQGSGSIPRAGVWEHPQGRGLGASPGQGSGSIPRAGIWEHPQGRGLGAVVPCSWGWVLSSGLEFTGNSPNSPCSRVAFPPPVPCDAEAVHRLSWDDHLLHQRGKRKCRCLPQEPEGKGIKSTSEGAEPALLRGGWKWLFLPSAVCVPLSNHG
uniref:Cystathionine gamma-lyase n=1 Tax=Cyanistes caeruleus TaxID=156563 RepID=A0A8C0UC00_CYACU